MGVDAAPAGRGDSLDCDAMWHPLYIVAGLAVGFLVGLTGIGGGSMMTPALVLLFGQSPSVAVGTDLIFAAATKSVATALHGVRGRVDWTVLARSDRYYIKQYEQETNFVAHMLVDGIVVVSGTNHVAIEPVHPACVAMYTVENFGLIR